MEAWKEYVASGEDAPALRVDHPEGEQHAVGRHRDIHLLARGIYHPDPDRDVFPRTQLGVLLEPLPLAGALT